MEFIRWSHRIKDEIRYEFTVMLLKKWLAVQKFETK